MVSILLNVYLMVSLDAETWAKFLAWMVLGDTLHCTHTLGAVKNETLRFFVNYSA